MDAGTGKAAPIRWRPGSGNYSVGGCQHEQFSWQWKLVTGAQWMLGAAYVGGGQRSNPDPVEAGSGKVLGWWKPTQAFSCAVEAGHGGPVDAGRGIRRWKPS